MNSDIKFVIYNVLTSKGIYEPEIVDIIASYDIKQSFFDSYEEKIQRWVCKKGKYTEIKTWYQNGILRSWYTLYNESLEGFVIEWHQNGLLSKRCYYTKGSLRLDMINIMWYENGNLAILKEPKLHRTWFPNGKISSYIELNEKGRKNTLYYKAQILPIVKYDKNYTQLIPPIGV